MNWGFWWCELGVLRGEGGEDEGTRGRKRKREEARGSERNEVNERNATLKTTGTRGTKRMRGTKGKRCTPADFGREGQECEGSGEGG